MNRMPKAILNDDEVIEQYKKVRQIGKVAWKYRIAEARVREILIEHGYLRKVPGKRFYEKVK